jgi:hemolysin III
LTTVSPVPARPRLRGVLHQHAFFAALTAAALLIAAAPSAEARGAALVYALGLCGLLGTSALYHRVTWSAGARRWMRRLDHSMIFVLIAATLTPVAVIVLEDPLRTVLLAVAWGGALGGVAVELLWPGAPKWVVTGLCLAIGWAGVPAVPQLVAFAPTVLVLLAAGGVLYTVGAVIYAVGRPNPIPAVFGYHEIFHAFVIAAAALHFAAVGIVVL